MSIEIILVSIVAGICCTVFLAALSIALVAAFVEHKKTKKPFSCCLEYHRPTGKVSFDGCSLGCVCEKCGEELLQDSQGNWFSIGQPKG